MRPFKKIVIFLLFCFTTLFVNAQNNNVKDTLESRFVECCKNGGTAIQCAKKIYSVQNQVMTLRYNELLKTCNKEQAENLKDDQLSFLEKLKRTKKMYEYDEYKLNAFFVTVRTNILSKKTSANYSSANYKVKCFGYYILGDTVKTFKHYMDDESVSELTIRQINDDSTKLEIQSFYRNNKPYIRTETIDTITVKNNRGIIASSRTNCKITFTFFKQGLKVEKSNDCKLKFKKYGYYRRVSDIFDDTFENEDWGRE